MFNFSLKRGLSFCGKMMFKGEMKLSVGHMVIGCLLKNLFVSAKDACMSSATICKHLRLSKSSSSEFLMRGLASFGLGKKKRNVRLNPGWVLSLSLYI